MQRYTRELEHAERIKALELGRTLRADDSWWTLPRISVAIGAGVPAVVFFCAWQASESLQDPEPAWICAARRRNGRGDQRLSPGGALLPASRRIGARCLRP